MSVLAVFCAIIATVNAVVDPQGRILLVDSAGFNEVKITPVNNRKGKARALRQCDYDTLILGTSRAESGIRVEQPALEGAYAYNAALKAATMYEMRQLVDYAMQYQNLKTVVIGLDLSSFNAKGAGFDDFDDSPLAETMPLASLGRYLVSLRTLQESWYTVRWNRGSEAVLCVDRGEHIPRAGAKPDADARLAFDFVLKRYASGQYYELNVGEQHLQYFSAAIEQLVAEGVQVYAFISPMHATHTELLREMGEVDQYYDWKRELVRLVGNANEGAPGNVALWDFSGYNTITTEAVPDPEHSRYMQWYRDSAHYKHDVGDAVMDQMLEYSGKETDQIGILLTAETIEAAIASERQQSLTYQKEHSAELERMREMLRFAPYPQFQAF